MLLHVESVFVFSLVWSVGCSGSTNTDRTNFDELVRAAIGCKLPEYISPSCERCASELVWLLEGLQELF